MHCSHNIANVPESILSTTCPTATYDLAWYLLRCFVTLEVAHHDPLRMNLITNKYYLPLYTSLAKSIPFMSKECDYSH